METFIEAMYNNQFWRRAFNVYLMLLPTIFSTSISSAQNQLNANGASVQAMGNTAVATENAWGLFNNVAAMGNEKDAQVISTAQTGYGLTALNTYATGFVFPTGKFVLGAHIQHFGDRLYSEESLGIGIAHKIGAASLGGKINFLQFRAEGLGAQICPAFDFGVLTKLSKQVSIGAYMFNFTQNTLRTIDEELPSFMQIGISYQPTEQVQTNVEVEQIIGQSLMAKVGLAYAPLPFLNVRMGANFPQGTTGLGIGLMLKQIEVDYALRMSKYPGNTHQFSLLLNLGSKQNSQDETD